MEEVLIKNCSEIAKPEIYKAYLASLGDEIAKEMDEVNFFKMYFGQEANSFIYSYIAYYKQNPIALLLGGIIKYDDIKTMRCSLLRVAKKYEKENIQEKLLELHYTDALNKRCCMMLLEVLEANTSESSIYKTCGYENAYFVKSYILKELRRFAERNILVEEIDISMIKKLKPILNETHMNWQNDVDYIAKIEGVVYYGILDRYNISGFVAFDMDGNIFRIWTHPAHRKKGMGRALLSKVIEITDNENLRVSVSSNAGLSNFLRRFGFEKDGDSLIEMVRPVLW